MKKKLKTIGKILTGIALVISALCLVFVLWQRVTGNIPNVFGHKIFRIVSASMEPELMVGDVILAGQVAPGDIQVGDILVYSGTEGHVAGKIVTHRVTGEPRVVDGVYWFQLQGIAPGARPDPPITGEQVIARYVRTMSVLTALFNLYLSPWGLALFLLLLAVLFAGEIMHLIYRVKARQPGRRLIHAPVAAVPPAEASGEVVELLSRADEALRLCETVRDKAPALPDDYDPFAAVEIFSDLINRNGGDSGENSE